MTKAKEVTSKTPQTPFPSAPTPWAWNVIPPGGIPGRDRCQTAGTEQERNKAAELVAEYRRQEDLSSTNDINGMSQNLDKLTRVSNNAGGVEGEMLRAEIGAADHARFVGAQDKLAQLRQEALDLIVPVLRRVLVSYSESLAQAAVDAEARLEANGLPLRAGNEWTLHDDAICRALWSCRIKIERTLFEIQPINAVGATQFLLTSEESTPFNWP